MATWRGRPPRWRGLAGGSSGSTRVHCSSVRSDGYLFRDWYSFNIAAHSSASGICANYLRSLVFCQALFPDSLLVYLDVVGHGKFVPYWPLLSDIRTPHHP